MRSFATLLLALSLPLYALAAHGSPRHHTGLARRARSDLLPRDFSGSFTNARCTFYDITTGLTACGGTYPASAFVVALNQGTFGTSYPSPYCGATITVTCNGKTASATIVDSCPGCPTYGGLDMTEGFFSFFADESVGVLSCDWSFGGSSGSNNSPANTPDSSSSTPQDTPTPTPTPTYVEPSPSPSPDPTTTTHTHHTTTDTPPPTTSSDPTSYPPPEPTTSSTPTTSSSPTTTSSPYTSSTPSSSPTPTPTPTPNSGDSQPGSDGNNLEGLNTLIGNYATIVDDCNDDE